MKLLHILLLSLFLSACSISIENNSKIIPIKWHKTRSQLEVYNICKKIYPNMPTTSYFTVVGCFWYEDNVCNVVSIDSPKRLNILGHEVKHCFDGFFHDSKTIDKSKFLVND